MWAYAGINDQPKAGRRRARINTTHDLAAAAQGRRVELGITQAELAMRAGVSRDWVNYFERGKRTVELALVLRLLDALGIGIEVMDAADDADPGTAATGSLDSIIEEYLKR
jgi:y4mF family transcriptional regulator